MNARPDRPPLTFQPSDSTVQHASKWGPVGFLAFAVVIVAGGLSYFIATSTPAVAIAPVPVAVEPPDRWTGTDQLRFEAANNVRFEKMDRMIERLDSVIFSNSKILERLLVIVERQDERMAILEAARLRELEARREPGPR